MKKQKEKQQKKQHDLNRIIHNVKGPVNRNISPQAACFPGKKKKRFIHYLIYKCGLFYVFMIYLRCLCAAPSQWGGERWLTQKYFPAALSQDGQHRAGFTL